jgi:putative phosphoribosyl transferase
MEKYYDRKAAGKVLADLLKDYANRSDVIVLALPRGGVPVAYEIAKKLVAPLDVFIVRKLGAPNYEELALGAIATGGVTVFNDEIIHELQVTQKQINQVIEIEQQELNRRNTKYRDDKPFPTLENKIVILVDDGIATGATMRAAIQALRQMKPANIVMAVPVAEISTYEKMSTLVDKIVCPIKPSFFHAVGAWYENFSQTEDEEVYKLLNNHYT